MIKTDRELIVKLGLEAMVKSHVTQMSNPAHMKQEGRDWAAGLRALAVEVEKRCDEYIELFGTTYE